MVYTVSQFLFIGNYGCHLLAGLEFYTQYSIRVQACTIAGCELSTPSSVRTLESLPASLDSPMLTPQATASGSNAGVLIVWLTPRRPNGIITGYNLERRQVLNSVETGGFSNL